MSIRGGKLFAGAAYDLTNRLFGGEQGPFNGVFTHLVSLTSLASSPLSVALSTNASAQMRVDCLLSQDFPGVTPDLRGHREGHDGRD